MVRESLTNVHRYASAAHVTVTVVHDDATVRVTVRNGARPTAPVSAGSVGTGRGLTGLRERVGLLGGTFDAAALPSGGFQVEAALPAEPGDAPGPARPATGPAGPDDAPGEDRTDDGWTDDDRTGIEGDEGDVPPDRRTAQVVALALGLVAVSVLMALGTAFVYATAPRDDAGPRPLPRVGMTYADVAGSGVLDNLAVRAAATGHEPPRPAGTVGCIYPFNGATESRPGGLTIARYCFDAAQRLIAIDRFIVPSVRDAAPWETP